MCGHCWVSLVRFESFEFVSHSEQLKIDLYQILSWGKRGGGGGGIWPKGKALCSPEWLASVVESTKNRITS